MLMEARANRLVRTLPYLAILAELKSTHALFDIKRATVPTNGYGAAMLAEIRSYQAFCKFAVRGILIAI